MAVWYREDQIRNFFITKGLFCQDSAKIVRSHVFSEAIEWRK